MYCQSQTSERVLAPSVRISPFSLLKLILIIIVTEMLDTKDGL